MLKSKRSIGMVVMTAVPEQAPTIERGGRPGSSNWRRAYRFRLVLTDLLVLILATFGAAYVTVGFDEPLVAPAWMRSADLDHLNVSTLIAAGWAAALAAALPTALVGLVLSRMFWRHRLRLHREGGRLCSRVLLVGESPATTSHIAAELRMHPEAGYHVVGAVTVDSSEATVLGTIPVLGDGSGLHETTSTSSADTVTVTDGLGLEPARGRQLNFSLEPGRRRLVMAPSLTDIAGPPIHVRPVAGLPLVHVGTPCYDGVDRLAKRTFDVCAAAAILLVLSLPLIVLSLTVLTTSRCGLFYSHQRIGKNGRPFQMLEFRSMVADTDSRLEQLLRAQGTVNKPLFKKENDPRITRIGAFIRRYSIDEVPQLINVLRGEMSLVGPRPQVAKEVAMYDNAAARRLLISPTTTELWQVSGRSNLGWEESVRLDPFCVEKWSITADIPILARTVRAVLSEDGAA